MASEGLVFIQHSRHSGKLSQDNAQKVWGYLSRRQWQKTPRKIEFKLWKSPNDSADSDDQQQVAGAMPVNALQRAYVSQTCLQNVAQPTTQGAYEAVLSAYSAHFRSCAPFHRASNHQKMPGTTREYQETIQMVTMIEMTIKSGVRFLVGDNSSKAFASFEWASRNLRLCVKHINYQWIQTLFPALIWAYLETPKSHGVIQLFLRCIEVLATLDLQYTHPIAVWARNLRLLFLHGEVNRELLGRLHEISDGTRLEILGRDDLETATRYEVSRLVGTWRSLEGEADFEMGETRFWNLLARLPAAIPDQRWRYWDQVLTIEWAEVCVNWHKFDKAEIVLLDAPSHLSEYISQGWVPDINNMPPLSATMVTWRLFVLGTALGAQAKHAQADEAFKQAVFFALRYYGADVSITRQALQAYWKYLESRGRVAEAAEIDGMLDQALEPYTIGAVGEDGEFVVKDRAGSEWFTYTAQNLNPLALRPWV